MRRLSVSGQLLYKRKQSLLTELYPICQKAKTEEKFAFRQIHNIPIEL
jgi:3-methyladenine DNA glycosylase AlkD